MILLVLVCSTSGVSAQNDSPLFPEECLTEPEPPEENSTALPFYGMLLMMGRYGIHGYKADWETPRVLAFLDQGTRGREIRDLSLSPDLRLAAVAEGRSGHLEGTFTGFYEGVNAIRIYPLDEAPATDIKVIRWNNTAFGNGWGEGFPSIHWLNNSSVVFQNLGGHAIQPIIQQIDAVTEAVSDWGANISYSILDFPSTLSPDGTRYMRSREIFDIQSNEVISKVEIVAPEGGVRPAFPMWSPDATVFVLPIEHDTTDIRLFDRDGLHVKTLATFSTEQLSVQNYLPIHWSPDSKRFAVITRISASNMAAIRVIDIEAGGLLEQCIIAPLYPSLAWSSDGSQLAIAHEDLNSITIWNVDTGRWQSVIQNNSYRLMGWRTD